MMDSIQRFFENNQGVFVFVYGQVLFSMGLAIVLQSRTQSRLPIVRGLPFLAVFGIVNGLAQWGQVLLLLQSPHLTQGQVYTLHFARISLLALSYSALMRFGLLLICPSILPPAWAKWLPVGLLLVWEAAIVGSWILNVASWPVILMQGETLSSYILAGPSALVAALGMNYYIKEIKPLNLPDIEKFLQTAGLTLAVMALFMILFVPYVPWGPALDAVDSESFGQTLQVPVSLIMSVLAVFLAYCVIRALDVFRFEAARALEEANRTRLLMEDRERIGRELHDGTIQSIYAAGLMIESARYLVSDSPGEARVKLAQVMQSLNDAIQDIRRYIFDLRTQPDEELGTGSLEENLSQLARDLRINTLFEVQIQIKGEAPHRLSNDQQRHVLRIVQEAFVNVSRHAHAKHVDVYLDWEAKDLRLRIIDDGLGFTTLSGERQGQGLHNMRERAKLLGGTLSIESQPGHGVVIAVKVPYDLPDNR